MRPSSYAVVLVLGMAGLLNRWTAAGVAVALLYACSRWWGGDLVEFGTYFAGGAVVALWNPPWRQWAGAAALLALAAAALSGGLRLVLATAGAYLLLHAVCAPRPR